MKDIKTNNDIQKAFENDCKVIEMQYEYSDYTGTEKYGIITALNEDELVNKYADLLEEYKPYIVLDSEFEKIRREFRNNEAKFLMRSIRGHKYSFDDQCEEHHTELAYTFEDEYCLKEVVKVAIERLPEIQKRRMRMYFFDGYNACEIAEIEGTSSQAIDKSIVKGLKNIKEFLCGGWN